MDTEKLRQIRADALVEVNEFTPQNCHKSIYHKTKFHLFDQKIIDILRMAQTTNSGYITSRQIAAISLFENIYKFMKAKDDEDKYAGADHQQKESIEKNINENLHSLIEAIKSYASYLSSDEEKKYLKRYSNLLTTKSIQ